MHHHLHTLFDGSIISFNNSILLWLVREYQLHLNPNFFIKGNKLLGGVFTSIIRSHDLDFLSLQVFHFSLEFLKLVKDFFLCLREVDPFLAIEVINKLHSRKCLQDISLALNHTHHNGPDPKFLWAYFHPLERTS